ncbi:unnamed protein product [Blepharisma stoltei]|uniref:Uncharacterized protein n=1 Tax=Blepharisma stoltei TaxID=1481888 RepID=A0AAU9IRU4_9CILI|nr:unnamed protein product [Blepharisma stoltei]
MESVKKKTVVLKAAQDAELQHLGLSESGTFFGFTAPTETLPELQESRMLENSMKVYLSKYLNRSKDNREQNVEKKELFLALMIALEIETKPGEILRCRQLPSGDVVVIYTSEQARRQMLKQGKITIQLEDSKRHVPIGPMNKNGEL